jgi:hypothetical protein
VTFAVKGACILFLEGTLISSEAKMRKTLENYNHQLMESFNTFIGDHSLREVARTGSKYTWTNKQEKPVLVTLDRFFISGDWEARFPLRTA